MAHNGMDALLGLESCEDEPIRTPGFIQPHGVLLALEPSALLIEHVSANSQPLLGLAPGELTGRTPAIFLGQRRFEGLAAAIGQPGFETDVRTITVGPDQIPIECTSSSYRDSTARRRGWHGLGGNGARAEPNSRGPGGRQRDGA